MLSPTSSVPTVDEKGLFGESYNNKHGHQADSDGDDGNGLS